MEFVKVGKNYMIKGSNGRIVSEKEKLQLENNELVLKDIKGCNCQKETTKKIAKNKKKIKEIEQEEPFIVDVAKKYEYAKNINQNKETIKIETAPVKEVDADDTIKETDSTI